MPRLKSRNLQIPNGLQFYIPQLKWSAPPYMSMDSIARSAISVLQANPKVAQTLNWDLSIPSMTDRVDEFNAALCLQLGHLNFVVEADGGQPDLGPFTGQPAHPRQSLANRLVNVAAGSETLVEWIASGAESVSQEQSTARAVVCVTCPHNETGGLERFFTLPVSNAIRKAYGSKREMKLQTPHDEALNVCGVCTCPLPLKVHVPLSNILKRMADNVFAQLPTECWIRKESGK